MTNKEILQADLLDILFEHRNKLYGAYALRKTYSSRLGIALAIALSAVLLFVLMSFIKKNDKRDIIRQHESIVKVTPLVLPEDKPKEQEPVKEKPKAQVDYQKIIVVPDNQADTSIVKNDDLENNSLATRILMEINLMILYQNLNPAEMVMLLQKSRKKKMSLLVQVVNQVFPVVLQHGLLFCNDIYKHQLMWNLVKE